MTTAQAPPPGEPSKNTLLFVFHTGTFFVFFTVGLCVFMIILDWDNPGSPYRHSWGLFVAHFIGGRMGNAGLGLEVGFPMWFIAYQCFIQDFVLMCFGYPLFVWGYKKFSHWPIIGPQLEQAHEAALAHRHRIRPYGILGLMFFVLFPMWATGPLVGVIMGYIIGLGTFTSFAAVGTANLVSTLLYVFAFNWIRDHNADLALYLVIAIFAGAIFIFAGRLIWNRLRRAADSP